jgi:cyclophilin family peptidyl-prolyl cis-trans isomerase
MLRWILVGALALLCACSDDPKSSDDDSGDGGGGSGGNPMGPGGGGSGGAGGSGGGGGTANPVIEIETSFGMMAVELDPERMPVTTTNFLTYVDEGFFAGTIIHRVIPNFVIQGGGFSAGLAPKPSNHPPITLETSPEILHDYGAISMARTDDPNSATSQFFLVNAPAGSHSLDGAYAAFGHLIEGSDVLDEISGVMTETVGQFEDVPVMDVEVTGITRRE